MHTKDLSVTVVGAGIGGLAAAIGLRSAGARVQLLEKAPQLRPVGAGLLLQPNAMLAIQRLGLDEKVRSIGMQIERGFIKIPTGKTLCVQDVARLGREIGAPAIALHRGDLQRVLLEALDGRDLRTGAFITQIHEQDEAVTVQLDDGTRVTADALIGADGVHSQVRSYLWGQQHPTAAGYRCWRGVCNEENLVESGVVTSTLGRGQRFGIVPIGDGKVYWFATSISTAKRKLAGEEARTYLLQMFGHWHQPIEQLIAATPAEQLLCHDLGDMLLRSPWGRGRMTLLGDAAHAMTPNLAQGAAMALEDAVDCASALQTAADVASWLRSYERLRLRRTTKILMASRRFGTLTQGSTWPRRLLRDCLFAHVPAGWLRRQAARMLRPDFAPSGLHQAE